MKIVLITPTDNIYNLKSPKKKSLSVSYISNNRILKDPSPQLCNHLILFHFYQLSNSFGLVRNQLTSAQLWQLSAHRPQLRQISAFCLSQWAQFRVL